MELISEALEKISNHTAVFIPQKHENATCCKKIDKDTAQIDWNRSCVEIHNLVRGLNPSPVAWTTFRDRNIKVWKTSVFAEKEVSLAPGQLMKYEKKRILAGTGDGCLEIILIQPEAKKKMDSQSFINGYRLSDNEKFV